MESELTELHYMNKVERLCDNLKFAVLCHNLLHPDVSEFQHYLSQIKTATNFSHIMERFRMIKMLTYSTLMFDKQIRADIPDDVILDRCLNNYSKEPNLDKKEDISEENFNKKPMTPMLLRHFKRMELDYGPYFKELAHISQQLASGFKITVDDNFAITGWPFKTNWTRQKLERVFKLLVDYGYIDGGKEEQVTFLSIFDITVFAAEKKITLIKQAQTKQYNVSWLYVLFKKLLNKTELSNEDKTKIANFFTLPGRALNPESIKSRDQSNASTSFCNKLDKALE